VASFEWPSEQPNDTYTIDVTQNISVELDEHFPVRPSGVRWYPDEEHTEYDIGELRRLFGQELTEAMATVETIGFCSLQLALGREERFALADLQLQSPSTPPALRRACASFLGEVVRSELTDDNSA